MIYHISEILQKLNPGQKCSYTTQQISWNTGRQRERGAREWYRVRTE